MHMKNPPHPGKVVRVSCLETLGLSVPAGTKVLGVSRQVLSNLVNGRGRMSPKWRYASPRLSATRWRPRHTYRRLMTSHKRKSTRMKSRFERYEPQSV